jgi:tetratricopeptide (TPR) repeat protein
MSNRGAAFEAMGDRETALTEYLAAVAAAPDFAAARYNAARLYAQLGDVDRCLPHLEKAMELVPDLRTDASDDDDLGWVLKLQRLKQERRRGPANPPG